MILLCPSSDSSYSSEAKPVLVSMLSTYFPGSISSTCACPVINNSRNFH